MSLRVLDVRVLELLTSVLVDDRLGCLAPVLRQKPICGSQDKSGQTSDPPSDSNADTDKNRYYGDKDEGYNKQ